MSFRALIVDDEETYASSIRRLLGRRGVAADLAATSAEGLERARRQRYDLVVLDQLLPDGSGLDLIPALRALRPAPRILMMTAFGTIDHAVEAMRRGAWDYVTKTTAIDKVVERILDTRQVAEAAQPTAAATTAEEDTALPELIGESVAMSEARRRIGEVARSPDTTVLLVGESGTGKGVAARAIHALGPRAKEPFVAVDCVSLPATLAESELFGHERGAFTGADRARPGRLELGGQGTVLLDEIGDMEPALQGKLLRVLEERVFDRVGGVKPVRMNARIIAATHRDLGTLVEVGRFRLDLYHRLTVFPIRMPSLRERGPADVLQLAEHFLAMYARRLGKRLEPLSQAVRDALCAYDFPGNVRELRNVIERAVILSATGEITIEMLPERLFARRGPALIPPPPQQPAAPLSPTKRGPAPPGGEEEPLTLSFRPGADTLGGLERQLIEEALRRAGGNKARAASLLRISRFALMRRLARYEKSTPEG